MLVSFDLLPKRRLVLALFSGTYATADGQDLITRFLNAPAEATPYSHLYDLSDVTEFDADFSKISSMVSWKTDRLSHVPKGTVCAICAPGDIAFGMARMYQSLSEGVLPFDMKILRSEAEALAAAGQSETTIAALKGTHDPG